tara:strand:- start:1249 stop:1413 length:165 start_codon:yes stop_codon:yes gene_type:complete
MLKMKVNKEGAYSGLEISICVGVIKTTRKKINISNEYSLLSLEKSKLINIEDAM